MLNWSASKQSARVAVYSLTQLGEARRNAPSSDRERANRISLAMSVISKILGARVRTVGKLPRGPALLVTDHYSPLDALAILPFAPALPLIDSSLTGTSLLANMTRSLGAISFDATMQQRIQALMRVRTVLRNGVSVLDFARYASVGPRPLYGANQARLLWNGSVAVATALGVPVVPMTLRFDDPSLREAITVPSLAAAYKILSQRRLSVNLQFGQPLWPRLDEQIYGLSERARNAIEYNRIGDLGRFMGKVTAGPNAATA